MEIARGNGWADEFTAQRVGNGWASEFGEKDSWAGEYASERAVNRVREMDEYDYYMQETMKTKGIVIVYVPLAQARKSMD